MKKYATLTNIIYMIASGIHMYYLSVVAPFLLMLGVTSAQYHYLRARQDAGLIVDHDELDLYQRLDVGSIYLVLGAYPFQLTNEPLTAICMLIGIGFMINKMIAEDPFDSAKVIPVLAIAILALTYFTRPLWMATSATAFIVLAQVFSWMADKFRDSEHYEGYDHAHGRWHNHTGYAFMLIH